MAVRKAATTRPVKSPTPAPVSEVKVGSQAIEGEIVANEPTAEAVKDYTIGNLKITMRAATEDQFMVLLKHARLAEKAIDQANALGTEQANQQAKQLALRTNEIFFRIVEKLIVQPEDVERLDDALADGTVTVKQITAAMKSEEQDGSPASPARTRRGR